MLIKDIDSHLQSIFLFDNYQDMALNGLQIGDYNQNINKIALAVDSNLNTIYQAISLKADILIVHHGLFFNDLKNILNLNYQKVSLFIKNNLALYAIHLPLDAHLIHGNNILLAKLLQLSSIQEFFLYKQTPVGVIAKSTDIDHTISLIKKNYPLHSYHHNIFSQINISNKKSWNIGVLTGQLSLDFLHQSINFCDIIITGEVTLPLYNEALDLGIIIIPLGHHHSEKIGVKNLSQIFDTYNTKLSTLFIEDDKPI